MIKSIIELNKNEIFNICKGKKDLSKLVTKIINEKKMKEGL